MEGLKVERSHVIKKEDAAQYGRNEIARVQAAIQDAADRLGKLKDQKIITKERTLKIKELEHAIAVGGLYLRKLKQRWI